MGQVRSPGIRRLLAAFAVAHVAGPAPADDRGGWPAATMPIPSSRSAPVAPTPYYQTSPVAPTPYYQAPPAAAVPSSAPVFPPADAVVVPTESHVYVYVVNGVDPLMWGGADKLAENLRAGGYANTRFGSWRHIGRFEDEIRSVHAHHPGSQFALIGFSNGTYSVRHAANRLNQQGIPIAMVGYLGGDYLRNTPYSRPGNVGRVVNVTGNGFVLTGRNLFFNGTKIDGAANMRLPDAEHYGIPQRPETLALLRRELDAATGSGAAYPTATAFQGSPGGYVPAVPAALAYSGRR